MIRHSRPRPSPALSPAPPAPIAPDPTDPRRPPWLPSDQDLQRVEPGLQQAIRDIILPAYGQLVLQTDDTLQRSLGMTIVHLMWLEVLDQLNLKRQYAQFCRLPQMGYDVAHEVDRHLRLIDAKMKLTKLLLRIRALHPADPAQDPAPVAQNQASSAHDQLRSTPPAAQLATPAASNGTHPTSDIPRPKSDIQHSSRPDVLESPPHRPSSAPGPCIVSQKPDSQQAPCAARSPQPATSP